MRIIDLHCDSLYKAVTENISLSDNSLEVKLISDNNDRKLQCYAIWLPDELSYEDSEKLFDKAYSTLIRECRRQNIKLLNSCDNIEKSFLECSNTAFFTVENAKALNHKLENVKRFSKLGVKMMTLTWNGRNDIGDGQLSDYDEGLTDFGKSVLSEMEKYNIIPDISHASDRLFYDVIDHTEKPIVASHSNSRSVTNHKRNLTDEQIQILINRQGLIGLNFHNAFLNDVPDKASMLDILKHTEHFLSVGAENILCLGSDFDGGSLPKDMSGSKSLYKLYELYLKHGYKEDIVQKIFYRNALSFFINQKT